MKETVCISVSGWASYQIFVKLLQAKFSRFLSNFWWVFASWSNCGPGPQDEQGGYPDLFRIFGHFFSKFTTIPHSPRLILGDSVSQSFAICVIVDRNSLDLKLVTSVPAKKKYLVNLTNILNLNFCKIQGKLASWYQ